MKTFCHTGVGSGLFYFILSVNFICVCPSPIRPDHLSNHKLSMLVKQIELLDNLRRVIFLGAQIELLSILRRAIKRAPSISINEGLHLAGIFDKSVSLCPINK